MSIFATIGKVQKTLSEQGIGKGEYNQHGKYHFRGIDAVYNALAPALAEHGLVIIPSVLESTCTPMTTSGGKPTNHWKVRVNYLLANTEEQKITCEFEGEAYDTSDKGLNKALTAAYKYLCFELFCIPVEGSDDADSHNHQADPVETASQDQINQLLELCKETGTNVDKFTAFLGIQKLIDLPAANFGKAYNALQQKAAKQAVEVNQTEGGTQDD